MTAVLSSTSGKLPFGPLLTISASKEDTPLATIMANLPEEPEFTVSDRLASLRQEVDDFARQSLGNCQIRPPSNAVDNPVLPSQLQRAATSAQPAQLAQPVQGVQMPQDVPQFCIHYIVALQQHLAQTQQDHQEGGSAAIPPASSRVGDTPSIRCRALVIP